MDKLRNVDWRGMAKTATQKVKKYTLNLTDLELKVEEATSAETWGPHGSTMNEIADAAFDPECYRQIMGVLARRLQERDENWRMCYKALLLLEHLLKHGPGKIVGDVQASSAVLERLENFQFKDANQRDHGVNVRHRAKEILSLVNSPDRLRQEREKAKANRAKYRGVSGDQMRMSSFGGASSAFGRPSGGGGAGSLGGGGGGGGGGGSFGASRRTDSYDETEHDSHFVSRAAAAHTSSGSEGGAGAGGSLGGSAAGAGASAADPVAATRARIERLKLSGAEEPKPPAEAEKKRLTDVRVNPKIAASLGLKMPAPAPAASSAPAVAAAAAAPSAMDLLGGLDDPAPPAAAAAAAPAPAFDPFAAPAAPQQQQQQGGWDAFGGPAPAAAPAGVDLLGSLSGPPQAAAARPAAPADPFAAFAPPAATSAPPLMAAGAPAAPRPAVASAVAAGVPSALPEDMFSDLTGIGGRPQQPMGQQAPPAAAPAAGMGGMGGWAAAPLAGAPMSSGGFGDFAGPGAPVGGLQAAPAPAPMQGGSSGAADPFANLLG